MERSNGITADVLIVGAGFIGLSVACSLLAKDPSLSVLIADAGDFASGGSGRNGAGIRMQWSRDFNIELSRESVETFENVEELHGYPGGIDFRQHGYLILAHSDDALMTLRNAVAVQNSMGVPSELIDAASCRRLQPGLNVEGLRGGAFCGKDGTANPFKWLDALLKTSRNRGARVHYGCRVHLIHRLGEDFEAETSLGKITSHRVIICTDWAAPELLRPMGIDIPISYAHKEAMVTEACPELVRTVLMASERGLGIKQMARGNILLTLTRNHLNPDQENTSDYLSACATAAIELLPELAELSLIRKWSGLISKTPDMQPVIGETQVTGLYLAVSAYKGFMISPAVGRIMADLVVSGHSEHVAARALHPHRFKEGLLVPETLTI